MGHTQVQESIYEKPLFKGGKAVYTRGFTWGYSLGGAPP